MYGYEWTNKYNIYRLIPNAKVIKEIRPVFHQELNYFGLNKYWSYPESDSPVLWAEGIRRYYLNGECIADAVGGGFYTKPVIKIKEKYDTDLKLQSIDIDSLWKENERLMLGLEKTAIEFIRKMHTKYSKRGMKFVVAFSGGKDSLVLLDLVAKALRPDEFVVIFSNTDMELSATLEAVEKAKIHYDKLHFYEAKSHLTAEESWEAFGPPGRRLRWCCSVHKSVPNILKIRELTGDYSVQIVVFEGVRREESDDRGGYDYVREGVKNANQINISPILEWGTAEIYLYLMKNKIMLNEAYYQGFFRVGCKICPSASTWWDSIANDIYKDELSSLLKKIEDYSSFIQTPKSQKKFVEEGVWKGRIGGFNISNGGNRIDEVVTNNFLTYHFECMEQSWFDVCKSLGPIVDKNENQYVQLIENKSFIFTITDNSVSYSPYGLMTREIIRKLRKIANKVAFCVGCKSCMAQCPQWAFEIINKKINIQEEICHYCGKCLKFTERGCLVAMTLHTTIGGTSMKLKSMDSKYKHFGFRREWLQHFFDNGMECFNMNQLGSVQYYALKFWLIDAGLLSSANKGEKYGVPTLLCERIKSIGANNPLVWSIIWVNLAYTSVISRWYMLSTQIGETYDREDLVYMLGDDFSQSTRNNAVQALLETLRHSPIGSVLKQGIAVPSGRSFRFYRQGWEAPDALALLYSLYKFAEVTGNNKPTLTLFEHIRNNPEAKGISPVSIFGLNPLNFKAILQDIAIAYPDYLRVVFQQDLDNIILDSEKKAMDVLDLMEPS